MNVGKITVGIIVALAAIAFFSIFIVKEVNQAIVLQFGVQKRPHNAVQILMWGGTHRKPWHTVYTLSGHREPSR